MKKGALALIIAAVLVAAAAAVILLGGDADLQAGKNENTVELSYGFSIRFPGEYAHMVEHTQEKFEQRTTEAFVLKDGDADISLYCICFGDRENGDWLGELKNGDVNVPITYTIFSPDEEELEKLGEEGHAAYNAVRASFYDLLDTITTDRRFVAEEVHDELVLGQEVEMTYWNAVLPDVVTFEETNQDGVYQADFFGEVNGEQVMLYSVRIGGESLQSPLGMFEIDGEQKVVSVESYSLSDRDDWSDDDLGTAYRMMDTINNVIDALMDSGHFAD